MKASCLRLLILGGGYGGTTLVHSLRHMRDIEVTLVNQTPFHVVQTEIHRYLGGATSEEDIYFDLKSFCQKNGANFVCDKALHVDDKNKKVYCAQKELEYDYLVVATGAVSLFPHQIQNIDAYAKDIKVAEHLHHFQSQFEQLVASKKKQQNIAVVGGGLSGVEIALEYASRLKRLGIQRDTCKISLIEQQDTLLPGCSKDLIEQSAKACKQAGIECYHGAFVKKIEEGALYLSDERKIDFSMVVLTIGVTSEQLSFASKLQYSQRNQFIVDEYLHVKDLQGVFAIGDVAYFEDENGNMVLPTAQNAKQQAKNLAKSIEKIYNNGKESAYRYAHRGTLVDLSKSSAIGDAFGFTVYGRSAYSLKRTVNAMHTRIFR